MSVCFSLLFSIVLLSSFQNSFQNKRQLLIFGKDDHADLVQQQLALLRVDSQALEDRDMIITVVPAESTITKKYEVPPRSFAVILIGKDGTEKHRSSKLVPTKDLFALIDAMPMRKNEVKQKKE